MTLSVLLALLAASPADCRDAYERLDLKAAVDLCQAALPEAPAAQRGELYRLLGLSFGALGDAPRARAAFVSLLALDPHAELSRSVSPKLRAVFDDARKRGGGAPVRLSMEPLAHPRVGQPLEMGARVEDGPARPVARLSLRGDGQETSAVRSGGQDKLELPPPTRAGPLSLELSAIDRFGGPLAATLLTVDVTSRAPPRPWYLSWPAFGAAAGLAAGAGLGLGLASRGAAQSAQSEPVGVPASMDLVRARNAAIGADVAFGAAAALAVGSVVLILTQPEAAP